MTPDEIQDDYRVVLYARVSTDDKGQTNETQIRELREYCSRMGWTIAETYTDEQTARNDKRPGFRELKGRISEGDIDYVVARNQDRISREPADYQNFLDYCRTFRVRVRFSDNDAKPETADGVLFDSIQAGLAKADNIKRSTGTKKGMVTAKLNGIHCGRMLMFCWSDEVLQNRARIQTVIDDDHRHRTVVMSPSSVMDLARQGYSIPKAAEVIGVSRNTLTRALCAKGMLEDFRQISSGKRAEGITPKRVAEDGGNAPIRDGVENVQKGTLADADGTVVGVEVDGCTDLYTDTETNRDAGRFVGGDSR